MGLRQEIYQAVTLMRQRWLRMVLILAVVTGSAAVVRFLMPRYYEATASVLLTGETSQIKLESNYLTVGDGRLGDAPSFRRTLAVLAVDTEIENRVLAKLRNQGGISSFDPGALIRQVKVTSIEGTNVLQIRVRARAGDQAAFLATTWAEVFVEYVNTLFSERAQLLPSLEVQLADAERLYAAAEEALTKYLAAAKAEEIELQIDVRRTILNDHYALLARLQIVKNRAEALLATLKSGAQSSALQAALDSLAVYKLQAPLLSASTSDLTTVQIAVGEDGAATLLGSEDSQPLQRLEALIRSMESQIVREQSFINESPLRQEILDLSAQLERENALLRELTQQRDAAWKGYTTVANKLNEVTLSATPASTVVRLAAPGHSSTSPAGPGLATVVAVAAAVGLMLAAADLIYRRPHGSQ